MRATNTDHIVYTTVCAQFRAVEAIAEQTGLTVAAIRVSLAHLANIGKVLHSRGLWFPLRPGAVVVRAGG